MNNTHPDTILPHQIWRVFHQPCLHWLSSEKIDALLAESRPQNELSDSSGSCICDTSLPSRSGKSFSTHCGSSGARWRAEHASRPGCWCLGMPHRRSCLVRSRAPLGAAKIIRVVCVFSSHSYYFAQRAHNVYARWGCAVRSLRSLCMDWVLSLHLWLESTVPAD